jgi:hypothetical protein
MQRFFCGAIVLCGLGLVIGGIYADDHHHHDGAGLKPNSTHQLHANKGGHSIHANTDAKGKVSSMHAMSGGKKVNHQKIVKADKKHAGIAPNGDSRCCIYRVLFQPRRTSLHFLVPGQCGSHQSC